MVDNTRLQRRILGYIATFSGLATVTNGACSAPAGISDSAAENRIATSERPAAPPEARRTSPRPGGEPADSARSSHLTTVQAEPPATNPTGTPAASPSLPGYLIGDPPLVEGYNIEEDSCVSGNWCGPASIARSLMIEHAGEAIGCAMRLSGTRARPTDVDAAVFAGLSEQRSMQATLQPWRTDKTREARKDTDLCCYHWFNYCAGRPLITEQGPVTAVAEVKAGVSGGPDPSASRDGWHDGSGAWPPLAAAHDDPRVRAEAKRHWLGVAACEHASIASFARTTLELMAVGAPMSLVVASQQAGLDESRHTAICLELARHHSGENHEMGSLPAITLRAANLATLVRNTFREACVGETIAAALVEHEAAACRCPGLRARLETIARDEARHAALGWASVRWALQAASGSSRASLIDVLQSELAQLTTAADHETPAVEPAVAGASIDGRLSPAQRRQIAESARTHLIPSLLAALTS